MEENERQEYLARVLHHRHNVSGSRVRGDEGKLGIGRVVGTNGFELGSP